MTGRPVEACKTTKYGEPDVASSTAVGRAIDWLQSYVSQNPYSDAANEACRIINELKAVHHRAGVDALLALIVEIAKTDKGLQEIDRATIRMSQPEGKTGEETLKAKSSIKDPTRFPDSGR